MYFEDHLPPHFHAIYDENEAMISIETGNIILGELPRTKEKLIQVWVEIHRKELMNNYLETIKPNPFLKKIKPLE